MRSCLGLAITVAGSPLSTTTPTLREVRVPAHAVNADQFPTNVEANRRHFASYELTLMTGVGHYLMLEDPARFAALLTQLVGERGGGQIGRAHV